MPPDPTPIIKQSPVIPVLTIERVADAVPLARALVAGGLPVLEITLRTQAALDATRAIAAEVPDCVVGVGTVLRRSDIDAAVAVGANFLVSPGTTSALAVALAQAPIPALPGAATVSEAMALFEQGFRVLKLFPAEAAGGVAWLKSVAAPLPDLRFCPTGGIDLHNAGSYLTLANVIAVGGSWPAPRDLIRSNNFAGITALAQEAATLRR
jgi:2-dehydro-3-deoxyphosphogluconate aldolase/(4S)-4-hydroxy-2-oxoglutarate aldolase